MSKKPIKKPKVPSCEYYAEVMGVPDATIDIVSINARLNQLGKQGWKLVCFTSTVAWFTR